MAEFLFCLKDKGFDPIRGYRRGDPVTVCKNGFKWGHREDKRAWINRFGSADSWPAEFVIVQIKDFPLSDAGRLLGTYTRSASAIEPEFSAPDISDRVVQISRKAWCLVISDLPDVYKKPLLLKGFLSISVKNIKPFFRHKLDGPLLDA